MKTHIFFRNLLLSLYIVVIFFQAYYNEGTLISRGGTAVILLISASYFVRCLLIKNIRSAFYKIWTIFFILNIACFIFSAKYSNPLHYGMFLSILMTFLSFYPFYYFSYTGCLDKNHLKNFFLLLIPVFIYSFFTNQSEILQERETVVNNVAYALVAVTPVIFLIKNRIFSVGLLGVLMFFIIQGAKRGAIIAGALVVVVFIFYLIRSEMNKRNIIRLLGVALLVSIVLYFGVNYFFSNEFVIDRMLKISEGGSGRDVIYQRILQHWYYSDSLINYLFGFGFASSLVITGGNYAHNDWLEILSNMGLVGVISYMALFYSGVRVFKHYDWSSTGKYIMLSLILVWFLSSMVSMWYTNMQGYLYSIFLAYWVANQEFNNQKAKL